MSADLGNTAVISPTDASNGSGTQPSWLGSAAPSTLDDAGRAIQGAVAREWENRSYPTSTGTAPNFVVAYTVAPAALRAGQTYTFTAHAAAVGSDDVNFNAKGAKNIKKVVAGVKTALAANDFYTNDKIAVTYDGTDMVWTNKSGSTPSSASTSAQGIVELATTTETLTGTDATRAVTPDSLAALWEAGSDITDGAAITIGEGGYFNLITSTTAITSFSITTDKVGRTFRVRFNTARTLTHNGTSLIIPGAANIATAQGDIAQIRSLGSGNVVVEWYTKASGLPIVSPSTTKTWSTIGTLTMTSGTSKTQALGGTFEQIRWVATGVSCDASSNLGVAISDDGTNFGSRIAISPSTSSAAQSCSSTGDILNTGLAATTKIVTAHGGTSEPAAGAFTGTEASENGITHSVRFSSDGDTLDAGSVVIYGLQ